MFFERIDGAGRLYWIAQCLSFALVVVVTFSDSSVSHSEMDHTKDISIKQLYLVFCVSLLTDLRQTL